MRFSLLPLIGLLGISAANAQEITITPERVEDRKAVIASVEPVRQLLARARIGGTILRLKVKEGDSVAAGAEVAAIADQKLSLQMQALEQRIRSQQAQRDQTRNDLDRVTELLNRGVSTKTQVEQARTTFDMAERTLSAMRADRDVIVQQAAEGAVLAPGAGRVISVAVSEGRVVMPGETIATLAEDNFILRLSLPERHARTMRAGDAVQIAARGEKEAANDKMQAGKIRLVYPEIQGGRVIADVQVEGLGNYFVGERARVFVTTGTRETVMLPRAYVFQRAGVNFVKLKNGSDIAVQPGDTRETKIEILSGLNAGDVVVKP